MRVSLIAGVLASAVVVTARTDHNYHQYAFYTQGDDETTQWGLNLDHDDGHAWNAPLPPPPGAPPKEPGDRFPHFPGKPKDSNETVYTVLSEKPLYDFTIIHSTIDPSLMSKLLVSHVSSRRSTSVRILSLSSMIRQKG